jgi:GTPase Era involved in 16S rRNA processing
LLKNISQLMGSASETLRTDPSGEKYQSFQKEIDQAVKNVENLELRMAIVAPMKAGKSTIINAIVGQNLLPSRNAAMTTLPTEIIFQEDLQQPILYLSPEILESFKKIFSSIQYKIDRSGIEEVKEQTSQYPHLIDLIQEIQSNTDFLNQTTIAGQQEITQVLGKLNDLVRLSSALDSSQDSLAKFYDLPSIKTPFLRSKNISASGHLGNLVIIDTPGPNEANRNLKLTQVVENQLKRSSIVLIVLDFTQLNNKAAEEVKSQVEPVIRLLGKENLYVLVNKVDQRREGDMTPKQVQEFVFSDLKLSPSSDADRVFEISARQAFAATKFLLELQQTPGIDVTEMKTAPSLAQEAFGARWESRLQRSSTEDLKEEAEYIWEESCFKPFLIEAIDALMKNAAPRCIKSALNLSKMQLKAMKDDLHLRVEAIKQDEDKLRKEIGALENDLESIEKCRRELRSIDTLLDELKKELNQILKNLQKEAQVKIEDYFINEDYERGGIAKKGEIKIRNWVTFSNWLPPIARRKAKYTPSGTVEFEIEYEAEAFADKAISWAKQRAEGQLSWVREECEKKVYRFRQKLMETVERETKPIIEKARQRLNKTFNIELTLPIPSLQITETTDIDQFTIREGTRYIDQGYGYRTVKRRSWKHWLWLVPYKEEQRYELAKKKENYYTVSLNELVDRVNKALEAGVAEVYDKISKYLEADFQQRVQRFFDELNRYLENYQNSLKQAQEDQSLSVAEKNQLVEQLESINSKAKQFIDKTDDYLARVKQVKNHK